MNGFQIGQGDTTDIAGKRPLMHSTKNSNSGKLENWITWAGMSDAIYQTHKQTREVYVFFYPETRLAGVCDPTQRNLFPTMVERLPTAWDIRSE
jgi:hypothetical protein